ncbi:MAG: DNA polymerase III, subunit gamma and tau [Flavobacteriaceae bacterium]|nr:DNA polymerase III, subunit gamma and tau [Flavobacteriaceae bacterium]
MNQFKVSALKYRPISFDEVVGQDIITTTLNKAIENNQLAKSLLFCGPRGVGKTTCARILAKKINNFNSSNNNHSYNIFELDAASNNSVEDIRNLTEQVRVPPQIGNFKVFIIDEAHMLTTSAFNAFLKTLEEPPSHAIFILATTEKNKIIPTILSRCQIYDFKRIKIKDIVMVLESVSKKQNISFEVDALNLIAEKADGALRDALTLFDQLLISCTNNLTLENVSKNLNVISNNIYFDLTDEILKKNIPGILIKIENIVELGYDLYDLISGMNNHFRNLLLCSETDTDSLFEFSESFKDKYSNYSSKIKSNMFLDSLDILTESELNYNKTKNKRILVELTFMKLASLDYSEKKKKIIPTSYYKNFDPNKIDIMNSKNVNQDFLSETHDYFEKKNTEKQTFEKKRFSKFSLSSVFEKNDISIKNLNSESVSKINHEFSSSDLQKSWKKLIKEKSKLGEKNIASILRLGKPLLKGNSLIKFEVPSESIKNELDNIKSDLLFFFTNELKNEKIKIDFKLNEKIIIKKAYTFEEKYKKLYEINPKIDKLKKEFGLD